MVRWPLIDFGGTQGYGDGSAMGPFVELFVVKIMSASLSSGIEQLVTLPRLIA